MREAIYIMAFLTFVIIFAVGLVAVLWALWGAIKIITELYARLRDRWATIHMGMNRYRFYLRHMRDVDKYIMERSGEEAQK